MFTLSYLLPLVYPLIIGATSSNVTSMYISNLTVEASHVSPGGNIVLRCSVANMDFSKFVRYMKLVPEQTELGQKAYAVSLSTNSVKEESITTLQRYSIQRPEENDDDGYDFVLNITEARVEDSGVYLCSIPQLNLTQQIQVFVLNDPTSIQLFVDDRLVSKDGEEIHFDYVTEHNITCIASGGYPQPEMSLSMGKTRLDSTVSSACSVENKMETSFLVHVTCTSTATVYGLTVDYGHSGSALKCTARSRDLSSAPLTLSLVPVLAGGLPKITCDRVVQAKLHDRNVHALCQVVAFPPLTDAYFHWSDGGGFLRPTEWQDGVKFAHEDHVMAYVRPQYGNYSLMELVFSTVHRRMFRLYHFVAVNEFGTVGKIVTLENEVKAEAVQSISDSTPPRSTASCMFDISVSLQLLSSALSYICHQRLTLRPTT